MRSQTDIRDLISLSLDILKTMILPSSLFCFDRVRGQELPRGVSVRYTLIVLLGLIKARQAGYEVTLDIDRIWTAALGALGSKSGDHGNLGLYLWVDSELGGVNAKELLQRIDRSTHGDFGLRHSRLGMDVGWMIAGAASAARSTGSAAAIKLLGKAVESICCQFVADCGLLYHFNGFHPRQRFPNFATQIYNVYALSCAAEFLEDERPLAVAKKIADKLLALQLPCSGWPWLYDADRGSTVERYEIYAVHQDAMAPMSLFKLSEVSGEPKYAAAAIAGLDWLYGGNELNVNMIDEKQCLIYRSIRRRRPFDQLMKVLNTSLSVLRLPGDLAGRSFVEVNPTCRPYHPGWILFAWAGRESSVGRQRFDEMTVGKKMRILVVTSIYPTAVRPNMSPFVKEQVESLRERYPDLTVDVHVIEPFGPKVKYLWEMLRLPAVVKKGGYDVVHAHFGLTLVAVLLVRAPVVVTFHGSDLLMPPTKYLSKLLAPKAAKVIVVAQRLRARLGYGEVIPCGIDVKEFIRPLDSAHRLVPGIPGELKVLFPSNPIIKVKDYDLFSSVCRELERRGNRVREIHLCNVKRQDVPLIYWDSDVMLLTSLSEGSPTVVKEAIAARLPFVSVDVGDVREWERMMEFGVVVQGRDPKIIADAVIALLSRIGDRRSLDNSRCLEAMDLAGTAERVRRVYDEVSKMSGS